LAYLGKSFSGFTITEKNLVRLGKGKKNASLMESRREDPWIFANRFTVIHLDIVADFLIPDFH